MSAVRIDLGYPTATMDSIDDSRVEALRELVCFML